MQRRTRGSAPGRFRTCPELRSLGEVGIVGSWELSRLSRTDKDWCRLLEVCQIFGTLIADEQHVYDLSSLDDQLVVGIKGTLSVIELKVLRQRMLAGQESKARRGELFKRLPVGYVRDAMDKVVFDPDQRVREALQFVFVKFRQLWSVRQTFQWFRDHDVELPVNPIEGTRLVWKVPSQSFIRDVLCNPFYAGAYVWGRRPVTMVVLDGRLEKRQSAMQRAEECLVFIREHHSGYIDWATYEENQRMIRRNSVNWRGDESMTAIRAGQGLLVGLLRCGHCGRKLHVRYWGGRGINARYLCKGDYDDGGQYCIGFGGGAVDRRLGQELLKVIFPTVIEEIVVRTETYKKTLELTIHWKGGVHTQLTIERPRSAVETATPTEAVEIIRRMAVRNGDDQIASVLNRLGYTTGKAMRWNQNRVATARRNYSIAGQRRALPDPERISLNEAARLCGINQQSIKRLVEAGLLKGEQVVPRAPWEIRRADLQAEPVRTIIQRLRRTGKLILRRDD